MQNITLSVGRDSRTQLNRYEYCVFANEKIIVRKGGFKSAATARRNGIKAAMAI